MSAFSNKSFQSLRDAFKKVRSNVPLLVTVSPSFEGGISDDSDIRAQETRDSIKANFDAIRSELANLQLKETVSLTGVASPHCLYVRATKSQLEILAKSPAVRQLAIAA